MPKAGRTKPADPASLVSATARNFTGNVPPDPQTGSPTGAPDGGDLASAATPPNSPETPPFSPSGPAELSDQTVKLVNPLPGTIDLTVMSDDPVTPPGFQPSEGAQPSVLDDAAGRQPPPDTRLSARPSTVVPQVPMAVRDAVAAAPVHRYEQRIRVIEAYRFDGNVRVAPGWIDRNWIAYADPVYEGGALLKPGGAALNVPTSKGRDEVARIGDYVVKQEVTLVAGVVDEQLEVWPAHEFERVFIPVAPLETRI
jgi:hypothetical protein